MVTAKGTVERDYKRRCRRGLWFLYEFSKTKRNVWDPLECRDRPCTSLTMRGRGESGGGFGSSFIVAEQRTLFFPFPSMARTGDSQIEPN